MKLILAKLHKIMSEVDFIEKDKTNEFHHYQYASEYAIKVALHKLLVDNKVLFTLSTSNVKHTNTLTDIDCTYKFYDIESGELLEGTFNGTGEDKLDKGTYKAITGAIKYILTSTFLIPAGDDPEKESAKPAQKQVAKPYNKPQAEPVEHPEFEPGDELLTGIGKSTGQPWYAIQKKDKSRIWLKKHQYEHLKESQN